MSFITDIFESNDREIKKINKIVSKIEAFEPAIQKLSDTELRDKTTEFKSRLTSGETLDDILPEAFAVVREAAIRTIGQRHFNVQMIGGIVLHQGRIAEMKTGEGKTLSSTLPAYLNALTGKGVHIVTVNDYLAKRDSAWMGKIHRFLGLTVGTVVHDMEQEDKIKQYNADITYATNSELGFDYLRDNMVISKEDMVIQRPFYYAIVDEVDSILIDEARTPLIISGAGEKSTEMYNSVDRIVARLKREDDFVTDDKANTINLTETGVRKVEGLFGISNLTDPSNSELAHHINNALRANFVMKRDKDYVVQDGQVIIVDEFTGRLMTGRRYSDGLHQAIEAKERVKVERESKTLATITYQNFFRMYRKLAGMTGTAKTEEAEFRGIYGLDVVIIPTNRPMQRQDLNDSVYRTVRGKFQAAVQEVEERHAVGQPILMGTVSVENSEILSDMLRRKGIKHEVLNAKFHEKEAEIVAQAGKFGAVTIATNMAGRGTDILLGGNPDFLTRKEMRKMGIAPEIIEAATSHADTDVQEIIDARTLYNQLMQKYKAETDVEHDKVIAAGGLHIIGTERHESRRIDNQLRGRSGRQGDPGSSRFYIALEDDLMRIFGSDRVKGMVERLGVAEDQPIEHVILTKQIENAQKRIESRNYDIRKNVLQYDDVMNTQREKIYSQRNQVLMGEDMHKVIMDMTARVVQDYVSAYTSSSHESSQWNIDGLLIQLEQICLPRGYVSFSEKELEQMNAEEINDRIWAAVTTFYAEKEARIANAGHDMREIERVIVLRSVDKHWVDHIDAMDQLRDGIGLRAYGQKDPVVEYKNEGFDMFEQMIGEIREDAVRMIFSVDVERIPVRQQVAAPVSTSQGGDEPKKPVKTGTKVGRNDLCPCGSGKKYKNCCMSKDE